MRFFRLVISLLLLVLLLSLPGFSQPDAAITPSLGCAIVAPTTINLSQASAVPIKVGPCWAVGRMFPDTISLKTDVGHFFGTTAKQLELKATDHVFPEVKLCFDTLTQVPIQPCHVSLFVDDKECASISITLRQVTAIQYMDSPPWIPLGEKEKPWSMSWCVYDQYNKPLAGVPGFVQYTLPGSPTAAVAGVSDETGVFHVLLPPAICEGKCTAQLVTSTCVSEPHTNQTLQHDGVNDMLPNLVAILAVPKEIIYPIQEDIPVLISVSSHDGRPMP